MSAVGPNLQSGLRLPLAPVLCKFVYILILDVYGPGADTPYVDSNTLVQVEMRTFFVV